MRILDQVFQAWKIDVRPEFFCVKVLQELDQLLDGLSWNSAQVPFEDWIWIMSTLRNQISAHFDALAEDEDYLKQWFGKESQTIPGQWEVDEPKYRAYCLEHVSKMTTVAGIFENDKAIQFRLVPFWGWDWGRGRPIHLDIL